MPKIIDLIAARSSSAGEESKEAAQKPFFALEFYPPRTEKGVTNLYDRLRRLANLNPLYVDFTWGAGGTTSDLTLELVVETHRRYGLETNMHLTCTNMEAEKITTALKGAQEGGIFNILALRGDPPKGEERWSATEGGFECALDLVKHIKASNGDTFGISVAGYPEGHPNVIKPVADVTALSDTEKGRLVELDGDFFVCSDADFAKEIAYLKEKVDAGAQFIVTQMFFDVPVFTAFVKACRAAGIACPIIPGIMLIQNGGGFGRMTKFCKSRVPAELRARIDAVKDDNAAVRAIGIEVATKMCQELIAAGVPGLHFYTLNLEKVLKAVLLALGLVTAAQIAAAAPAPKKKAADTPAEGTAAPAAPAAAEDDATQAKGTILASD